MLGRWYEISILMDKWWYISFENCVEFRAQKLLLATGKCLCVKQIAYIKEETFPNCQTLSGKLGWSYYQELIKLSVPLEMQFYITQCENGGWGARDLQRQMKSMLFHIFTL